MSSRSGALNMWHPDSLFKPGQIGEFDTIRSVNAGQPGDSSGLQKELSLSLAVVCTAIVDIHRGGRKRFARESDARYIERKRDGRDAEDFLLIRLNEEDNHWGRVLRQCGMRPLTKERVAHLVRNRAFLTLEQFTEVC